MFFVHRFYKIAKDSKDELIALGFPKFTLEDFHDMVSHLFSALVWTVFQCHLIRTGFYVVFIKVGCGSCYDTDLNDTV